MAIVFTFLLSQSVLIPLAVILVRIKKIPYSWVPFAVLIVVAFISEIASFVAIEYFKSGNAPIIKMYSLLECCIILYQFRLWNRQTYAKKIFWALMAICILFWAIENILFLDLNTFSPFFRIFYAFIIVLISINQINAMIVRQDGSLLKEPKIVLSIGFIIFFIYQIIYEASFYIGSDISSLANKIILGFGYINFGVNIIYAVVILLINKNDERRYNGSYSTT